MKDAKGHGSNKRGEAGMTPGARVSRTMGIRRTGVVTKPFPVDQSNDGTYYSPAMGKVPVQWDDGTKGYEHAQHLATDTQAASELARGNPKAAPAPVHGGVAGRSYGTPEAIKAFTDKYGGPRDHAAEQRGFNSGKREINRLKRQGK
jgi:hypothetical protein